jgi:hypothetical protein
VPLILGAAVHGDDAPALEPGDPSWWRGPESQDRAASHRASALRNAGAGSRSPIGRRAALQATAGGQTKDEEEDEDEDEDGARPQALEHPAKLVPVPAALSRDRPASVRGLLSVVRCQWSVASKADRVVGLATFRMPSADVFQAGPVVREANN